MRVAINRLCTSGPQTGIGHYTSQLLRGLHASGEVEIDEVPGGWVWRLYGLGRRLRVLSERHRSPTAAAPSGATPPASARPPLAQRLVGWLRRRGQRFLRRHTQTIFARRGLDLYHEPNNVPLPCDLPTVATVHDLSVLLHPEWHPADRVAYFEREFLPGVARCVHLLAVSEFARREIITTLGVPPERVSVTYNGMRAGLRPLPPAEVAAGLRRLGLPPNYLLYLGTLEPRKNVLMLLRVYCSLPASVRERYPLVLAGGWGWNTGELADYYHDEARHRGVRHLGYVADGRLPLLYNGARALLFPSFYEGYGLPPVEMLACGGAVLASTAGAIVELAGGVAHLLDPRDADGWRAAILRVTGDDDWWRRLRRGAVEAARPYTWERCAADTLAVYRKVLGLPPARTEPRRLAG